MNGKKDIFFSQIHHAPDEIKKKIKIREKFLILNSLTPGSTRGAIKWLTL